MRSGLLQSKLLPPKATSPWGACTQGGGSRLMLGRRCGVGSAQVCWWPQAVLGLCVLDSLASVLGCQAPVNCLVFLVCAFSPRAALHFAWVEQC